MIDLAYNFLSMIHFKLACMITLKFVTLLLLFAEENSDSHGSSPYNLLDSSLFLKEVQFFRRFLKSYRAET